MGRSDEAAALREELAAHGSAVCVVRGDSMLPSLPPGTRYRLTAAEEIRAGDVIVFELAGTGLLVHRVVRLSGDRVRCRGDNRLAVDPWVPREAVLGRLDEVLDAGGVRGGRGGWARAQARWTRRFGLHLAERVVGEAGLLLLQTSGREPWPWSGAGRMAAAEAGAVVVEDPVAAAAALCALPPVARTRVVRERLAAGRPVQVFDLAYAGRLTRLGARARRLLARSGVQAGLPGDAWRPSASGRPGVMHYFSQPEFAGLVERQGGPCAPVRSARRLLVADPSPAQRPSQI